MQRHHLTSSFRARSAALVVAVVALAAPAMASAAGQVWVTHATQKVRPTDAAGNQTSATISAARNEYEAFQVVVTGAASGVQATVSDLVGPGTIPASAITMYREALYNATNASGPDGAVGMWPDGLVPDVDVYAHEKRNAFPFDVPAGENRTIWVEVLVPQDAAPGPYTGKVTVLSSSLPNGQVDVPVTLTVRNFTLPSTPSLKTAFGLSWSGPCTAHYGSTTNCDIEATRNMYVRAALENRISIEGAVYAGPGGSDWTHFDQVYGPLLDGTATTRLTGAKLTTMRFQDQRTQANAANWASHFKGKGWFNALFDYTCDEPPITCSWSDIPARAQAMKSGDPDFKTLVTTTVEEAKNNGVDSSINYMVPVVNFMEPKGGANDRPSYDPFLQQSGNELWWYQSCMSHGCGGTFGQAAGTANTTDPAWGGWPNYSIDAQAMQSRAQEWLSFKNKITGELYYETAMHLDTAWTDQWDFGANGDGTLFYPGRPDVIGGTTHIPVESIRLKLIREGVEDYEYLKMLSDLGDGAWAMDQVQSLFPAAGSVTGVTPEAMYAVRDALAAKIESHFAAPATTGGSTGGTTGASTGQTGTSSGVGQGSGIPGLGTTGGGTTGGSSPAQNTTTTGSASAAPGTGKVSGGCGSTGDLTGIAGLFTGLAILASRRRRA